MIEVRETRERSSFIAENLFDMKLKRWEFIWQPKQTPNPARMRSSRDLA